MEIYKAGEWTGAKFAGTVFAEEFAFYLASSQGTNSSVGIQHNTTQHNTTQHNTIHTRQHNTTQYNLDAPQYWIPLVPQTGPYLERGLLKMQLIKVKSYQSMTSVLMKRGNLAQRREQRENKMGHTGRRQPSISQGERPGIDPSLIPSEGTRPANTLILNF